LPRRRKHSFRGKTILARENQLLLAPSLKKRRLENGPRHFVRKVLSHLVPPRHSRCLSYLPNALFT
jgi:hypothetical protein